MHSHPIDTDLYSPPLLQIPVEEYLNLFPEPILNIDELSDVDEDNVTANQATHVPPTPLKPAVSTANLATPPAAAAPVQPPVLPTSSASSAHQQTSLAALLAQPFLPTTSAMPAIHTTLAAPTTLPTAAQPAARRAAARK